MRVLYYAAALISIGDHNKAAELIGRYMPSEEIYAASDTEDDMQTEYINTLMLYINTRLDPDAAYKYLKEKAHNIYVSDVPEKINFIRYFTFMGGTRSEIEYTLDGVTKKAVFENHDILELTLTKEQFEALNIRQISGNTSVGISFYGSPENFDESKNEIILEKQIMSKSEFLRSGYSNDGGSDDRVDDSAYYIILSIRLPAGTPRGHYTIRDRLPNNMRYLNINRWGWRTPLNYYVSNPEKQFADIGVYYDGRGGDLTVIYNAVRISESDAVTEKAYVSRGFEFDIGNIWGDS
jgi:hypothetical protein